MRISIAVHGRFHAFDLAAALLRAGHEVRLLTNYPRRKVAQWFPPEHTQNYLTHAALSRAARGLAGGEPPPVLESALKRMFGRWAARRQADGWPDIVHCWSGVAEESLRACGASAICTMARGSAHIRTQFELLAEEQRRVGRPLEQPSAWIIAREEREYQLADRIIVPSQFVQETFVQRGVPPERIALVNLALRAPRFIADARVIEQRVKRIRSGAPLRVLYTGMISFRKGMHDLLTVLQALGQRMQFRLVGPLLKECDAFAAAAARHAGVQPALPENELPGVYAWGDVFLFPTIEDGFAVVLAQAQAAGLPILATPNCGAPDIIAGGGQGWIVPPRNAAAIIERLHWCHEHRNELASMVEELHINPPQRNWDDVARDFVRVISA